MLASQIQILDSVRSTQDSDRLDSRVRLLAGVQPSRASFLHTINLGEA
jgi:hypothetical protein